MCLGFLSMIPAMLVIDPFFPDGLRAFGATRMPSALDPEALPDWLDRETYAAWYRLQVAFHIAALAGLGAILGFLQSRELAHRIPRSAWILATALGFPFILISELIEPHIVVGPHGGPFEPILISLGGGSLAGLGQWLVLKRNGISANRWLCLWVLGLAAGVVVAAAVAIGLDALTQGFIERALPGVPGEVLSWSRELLVLGAVLGAVAAAISARALATSFRNAHA
jgi:hypothetical protein